jgi:hypothetical protein
MSWGTNVKVDLFLSHIAIRDIDDHIESSQETIRSIENEIAIMVGANIRDLASDEDRKEGTSAESVKFKLRNIFNDYKDEVETLYRLELVKDNIDEAVEG